MPVPAIIENLLQQHAIKFGVSDAHLGADSGPIPGAAKTTILQDSEGKVQAIYSADCILDIDKLRQWAGRNFKAISPDEAQTLCNTIGTERLPTIPHVFGLDVIIDRQLLDLDELKLDTGSERSVIIMDSTQFKGLIDDAHAGSFTVNEADLQSSSLDSASDTEQITSAVANFTQLRIKQRLEETLEFPPLPTTAQRIIKLRADPNADIRDLSDIVESDPALAAQVVSWAASPYYAAPGKIKSVHDAIVRVLGFDLVLNLSLGLALGKTLNLPKDNPEGFTSYWQQAVYTATAVEALVSIIPPKHRPSMGIAYLSGLLHNFGYLILAEVFPPHFSNICRYQEANPYSNHSHIDRHLLGITREQLGAWLMRLWNMPEEVCSALRYQNEGIIDPQLQEGGDPTYANLLLITLYLLRQHGIGDASLTPIPDAIFESLHLDRDKASETIEKVMGSSAEIDTMASNMAA